MLMQQLNDGSKYLVKYGLPSIFVLVASSSAFGGVSTTRCFSAEEEVLAHGNGKSLGHYRADARVSDTADSAFVSFSVSMPDSPQVLIGENVTAMRVNPTTYIFRFVDGWGNHSKGKLTISGKRVRLNLVVEKLEPIGTNITRNYGEHKLNTSSCKEREK